MVKELTVVKTKKSIGKEKCLVLFNDDVNTFDWVIKSLVDICNHTEIQAEQCAWIVHYKGKCTVSHGKNTILKARCSALLDRGLTAEIQ